MRTSAPFPVGVLRDFMRTTASSHTRRACLHIQSQPTSSRRPTSDSSLTTLPRHRSHRPFHSSRPALNAAPGTPASHPDRGPASTEDTVTDFSKLDVLGNTAAPSTAIDACLDDGFQLDSGLKITGGCGVLLVNGEAFGWKPWLAGGQGGSERGGKPRDGGMTAKLLNERSQWGCADEAWGVLDLVYPKPDLLILGLGPSTYPITPATRAYINSLGIMIDIQDTRNAAAQFNLLATERGVGSVAAALLPMGWKNA